MNRTRTADVAEVMASRAKPSAGPKGRAKASKKSAPSAQVHQGPSPEFVPLKVVADELRIATKQLIWLERRGRFIPILRVSNKHLLVRRDAYEQWKAGRWSTSEASRAEAVGAAVRQDPSNHRN